MTEQRDVAMTLTDDHGVRHLRSTERWRLTRMTLCEVRDKQDALLFSIPDNTGNDQSPTCLWCVAHFR